MCRYLQLLVNQGRKDQSRAVTQTNRTSEEDGLKVFGVSRSTRGAHQLEGGREGGEKMGIEGGRGERVYILSFPSIH